jgi:hypothetical protein
MRTKVNAGTSSPDMMTYAREGIVSLVFLLIYTNELSSYSNDCKQCVSD